MRRVPRNVRNVYRYEHNYFRGWLVTVKRGGSPHREYFTDDDAGPQASFKRAVAYREWLLRQLPAFNKLKRRYERNTTGEIGVARCVERTRAGTRFVPLCRHVARRVWRKHQAQLLRVGVW